MHTAERKLFNGCRSLLVIPVFYDNYANLFVAESLVRLSLMDFRHPSKAVINLMLVFVVVTVIAGSYIFISLNQTPADYCSSIFELVNEPRFSQLNEDQSSVRIIYGYTGKTDIIRITKSRNDVMLRGICLINDSFNDWDNRTNVIYDSTSPIKVEQWKELVAAVSESSVWHLSTSPAPSSVLYESGWILEIKLGSAYKVISRGYGFDKPEFADLAKIDNIVSKIAKYDSFAAGSQLQPNHTFNLDAASASQRPRPPL